MEEQATIRLPSELKREARENKYLQSVIINQIEMLINLIETGIAVERKRKTLN